MQEFPDTRWKLHRQITALLIVLGTYHHTRALDPSHRTRRQRAQQLPHRPKLLRRLRDVPATRV